MKDYRSTLQKISAIKIANRNNITKDFYFECDNCIIDVTTGNSLASYNTRNNCVSLTLLEKDSGAIVEFPDLDWAYTYDHTLERYIYEAEHSVIKAFPINMLECLLTAFYHATPDCFFLLWSHLETLGGCYTNIYETDEDGMF